jgi:hypothetical protein
MTLTVPRCPKPCPDELLDEIAGSHLDCQRADYAPRDDVLRAFRDSSVENYLPAVAELSRLCSVSA